MRAHLRLALQLEEGVSTLCIGEKRGRTNEERSHCAAAAAEVDLLENEDDSQSPSLRACTSVTYPGYSTTGRVLEAGRNLQKKKGSIPDQT